MTEYRSIVNVIMRCIRADSFVVSAVSYLSADGPGVRFTAWL